MPFQKGNMLWDNPISKRVQFKKGSSGFVGKHSEESKRKMSNSKKGKPNLLLRGRKLSEERKRIISETHKGKKQSPELIAKRVAGRKGYRHSEETKRKIGKAHKGKERSWLLGKPSGMLGKKHPEEWKRKMSEAQRGEKHYNWKGGITSLVEIIRGCFKNRQWRSDIFTRDNFTCVLCGKRGGNIEADHYPKMFSTIFHENKIKTLEEALACEEFWNINNGRTLCSKCHNKNKKHAKN